MGVIRIILSLVALIVLVWSGYLVKVKGDRSKKPMILAVVGLIMWVLIWMIEKSS